MKITTLNNFVCASIFAVSLGTTLNVHAKDTSADNAEYQQLLTQGHSLFKAKDYSKALSFYLASQDLEPLDSTLYNIGICHFKLKKWPQALSYFKQITIDEQSATVVTYNIAVTYKKLKKFSQAQQTFEHIILWAEDDKLINLASQQIKALKEQGNYQVSTHSTLAQSNKLDWQALVNVSYGNDNNVLEPDEDSASNTSDQFIETLATASIMQKNNWSLDLLYYGNQYSQASDYDISLISLSGRKYFPLANKDKLYLELSADKINLAGQPYISNQKLSVGYKTKLNSSNTVKLSGYLKRVSDDDSAYHYIAGTSSRLAAKWWYGTGNAQWTFGAKFTADRRNDRLTETSFTSYSTNRLLISTGRAWQWGDFHLGVNANYRMSEYIDTNSATFTIVDVTDTGIEESTEYTTSATRSDKRFYVSVDGEYEITPNWSITGEINRTDNSSNIDSYEYDQQNMMLGVSYQF
ncbi:tetratricopeptide repeat protein [Algibacillus agarilyticus]|uniref:tetratricopeptide repeat protein n=1 Tax=Algibacillus agarilyticus TaxID=2234133 RepID=UPI000DD0210D|nr:tetratricopeptide repeat protein [Algibacillus agarilyticus]